MSGIDLPAQSLHVNLDEIRGRIVAFVPDVLREFSPADDCALAPCQVLEQRILLCRKHDGLLCAKDLPLVRVDAQVGDMERWTVQGPMAPKQRMHACQQFSKIEG